jgi:2-hydroxyacyl-CoA lyase 1
MYNNKLGDFKSNISEWNNILNKKCEKNKELNKQLMASKEVPMTYYNSGGIIKENLPKNTILIG